MKKFGCGPERILENAAHAELTRRLARLGDDPLPLHAFGENFRRLPVQLKRGFQDRQFVQTAGSVPKPQFVALAGYDLARSEHDCRRFGPGADVADFCARIAMQRAADRAGDANQRFQPRQALADGGRYHMAEFRAATSEDSRFPHRRVAKCSCGQPHNDPGNAFVADKTVGTSAEQAYGPPEFGVPFHQSRQLLYRRRFRKVLGGAAEAKPSVLRQWLAGSDKVFKTA